MGKSAFALALAQELGAEIVSADSMQVYRKLNIGTAKPSPEEQQLVPHHLIDLVEPWENFDLAKYQQLALSAIGDIHSRGKLPLLTGGTGLYVRAVLEDYLFPQKSADKNVRAQLESFTTEQLYARLEEVDPDSALRLHPNDRRRIERAVEVFLVTGKPISQQQAQMSRKKRYRSLAFCLTRERSELYERINKRVDLMMEQGLLAEAKMLYELKLDDSHTAMQAIGYKEFFPYFRGECTLEEAVSILKRNTRRYAKRQLSWFRQEDVVWLNLTGLSGEEVMRQLKELAAQILF
ncbi:MAG: tRNA (adenosine(37)-N6)-dimethylallyltransferase MiaA [Firmicutes bacterium]|nr:tRNA (adenosine(37)-N6)-dimethylallyltransferase MiaA [Bacillota bacterium]